MAGHIIGARSRKTLRGWRSESCGTGGGGGGGGPADGHVGQKQVIDVSKLPSEIVMVYSICSKTILK